MNIKLYVLISLVVIGGCSEPKGYFHYDQKTAKKNECFFDSTCSGCQRLELPFSRHWASKFSNMRFFMPFIIHISFNEQFFEIVNNGLIESEILIQRGKNSYYEAEGVIPTIKKSVWSDSTMYMVVQYFPYPKVNRNQPHPLSSGSLNKYISSALLSGPRTMEYHFFQLESDTLVQYYFEIEKKYNDSIPLETWLPQAMKISHPLFSPTKDKYQRQYIIEYMGNKCMCPSSVVKVFDRNPIRIKDSQDSY